VAFFHDTKVRLWRSGVPETINSAIAPLVRKAAVWGQSHFHRSLTSKARVHIPGPLRTASYRRSLRCFSYALLALLSLRIWVWTSRGTHSESPLAVACILEAHICQTRSPAVIYSEARRCLDAPCTPPHAAPRATIPFSAENSSLGRF
jgi:hypothetical protein